MSADTTAVHRRRVHLREGERAPGHAPTYNRRVVNFDSVSLISAPGALPSFSTRTTQHASSMLSSSHFSSSSVSSGLSSIGCGTIITGSFPVHTAKPTNGMLHDQNPIFHATCHTPSAKLDLATCCLSWFNADHDVIQRLEPQRLRLPSAKIPVHVQSKEASACSKRVHPSNANCWPRHLLGGLRKERMESVTMLKERFDTEP